MKNIKKNNCLKNICIIAIMCILIAIIINYLYETFSVPKIVLEGYAQVNLNVFENYVDKGAKSTLNYKKNNVKIINSNIDTTKVGNYNITYGAVNKKNKNMVTVTRKVIVEDKTAPIITLNGDKQINIIEGDLYKDLGAKAIDNVDGDITDKIQIENNIDVFNVGKYVVTYSISDFNNNISNITRTVNVIPKENTTKTIYLTFDDGPSLVTESLLNMLDKNNVKATFFIVGNNANLYKNIVKRESDSGHAIAVHCYDHDYSNVYKSDIDFFQQLNKTKDIIYNITGKETKIFRFPGGSSNTISKKYSLGIMSRISTEALNKGYIFFDWNIDSMDASAKLSSNQIYNNMVKGLNVKSNTVVVLCHDANTKQTTIEAVDMFINYCKNKGYSFKVITNNTPNIRHKIVN